MNLSKKQIDKDFISNILPSVKQTFELNNRIDKPARYEAYNNYIDYLNKDGLISESQANKYCIPKRLIN